MSKKKRNRRPNPSAPGVVQAAAGTAVAEMDEAALDGSSDGVDGDAALAPSAVDGSEARASVDTAKHYAAASPALAPVASDGWVPHESGDIRGVLIQIGGGRLLLPNATIAEVLSYAEPEAMDTSADWLLGRFRWRGWQIPLIAFSRLAGIGEEQPGLGSKVIVLKALGGDRRIPYFAILTQGFPRLVTVARSALEVEPGGEDLPVAVQARLRLNNEPALLPDLLQVERMLQAERERDVA